MTRRQQLDPEEFCSQSQKTFAQFALFFWNWECHQEDICVRLLRESRLKNQYSVSPGQTNNSHFFHFISADALVKSFGALVIHSVILFGLNTNCESVGACKYIFEKLVDEFPKISKSSTGLIHLVQCPTEWVSFSLDDFLETFGALMKLLLTKTPL